MKALRFVLLGLALVLIAGIGYRLTHDVGSLVVFSPIAPARLPSAPLAPKIQPVPAPSVPQPPPAPPVTSEHNPDAAEARKLVLSRLADAPTFVPFFDALRTDFPSDYMTLVDHASELVAKGGHVPNPDRLLADGLRIVRERRGVLAAQAEAGPLSSIFAAQGAMLDALAPVDPALCVDFLYGGTSPDFMAFSATHRDLAERIAISSLSAIKSGQEHHIERDPPTQADFDTLAGILAEKKLSPDEISALLDGKTFDPPLPEKSLCEAGRTYLQVLETMPDDTRLRIYALSAQLLARS